MMCSLQFALVSTHLNAVEKENEHQSQGFIALLSYVDRLLQEKTAKTDQAIDGSQVATKDRTVQAIDRSYMATIMDTDKKPEQNITDEKANQNIRQLERVTRGIS